MEVHIIYMDKAKTTDGVKTYVIKDGITSNTVFLKF